MTKEFIAKEPGKAFWLTHADPTQAAVHLALQWLAFVYPAAELQIDRTLQQASPYADADLSSRWSQFLDEQDVEEHVEALGWLAQTLSVEQVPFLIETCWRLLLVDHELPSHVPLAMRILGQVLNISEANAQELGESVYREYLDADEERNRAPLLPVDPRYLDRVEWRLYGHSATQRHSVASAIEGKERNVKGVVGFIWGSVFGATVVAALVFGPLQLGRVKVPIMLHDGLLIENADVKPEVNSTEPTQPVVATKLQNTVVPAAEVSPVIQTESASENISLEQPIELPAEVIEAIIPLAQDPVPQTTTASSNRELMEVTASLLNVRAEASVDSDIVIKLAGGAKVWAYPEEAEGLWMLIKVEGQVGYASTRFLTAAN